MSVQEFMSMSEEQQKSELQKYGIREPKPGKWWAMCEELPELLDMRARIQWWKKFLTDHALRLGSGHSRTAYEFYGIVIKVPHDVQYVDMNRCEARLWDMWQSGLTMGYENVRPNKSILVDGVVLFQERALSHCPRGAIKDHARGGASVQGGSDGCQGGYARNGDYVLYDFAQYPSPVNPEVFDMHFWQNDRDGNHNWCKTRERTWPENYDMRSRESALNDAALEWAYWRNAEIRRKEEEKRRAEREQERQWRAESEMWRPLRAWEASPEEPRVVEVKVGAHGQWWDAGAQQIIDDMRAMFDMAFKPPKRKSAAKRLPIPRPSKTYFSEKSKRQVAKLEADQGVEGAA